MPDMMLHGESFELTDAQYIHLVGIIYEKAGISLGANKKELLHARLGKVLRRRGIPGFREYLKILRNDESGDELIDLLDAVSTNVTHFFREEGHFSFLAERLADPGFPVAPRIWCAGCSSGEEPYSVAITLLEYGTRQTVCGPCILATDLSTRMLERAAAGVYPLKAVEGLDAGLVKRHFLRGKNSAEGMIRVKRTLAGLVSFERRNLIEPFPPGTPFHVIFCRNVMIYFDTPTRQEVVQKFHQALEPGGYLIIGHSESLNGINHPFQYIQPTIYRKA